MQSSCKGPGRLLVYNLFILQNLRLMALLRFVRKGRRILQNIRISNMLRFKGLLHFLLLNRDKT